MRCFPDWSPCAPSRGRETGVSEVDTCTVSHVRSVHTITLNTRVSIQLTSKCAEVQMSLTRDGIGDIHCHYHTAQIRRSTHYRSRRARFRSTFDLASTQVRVAPHICLRYLLLLQHALAYFIANLPRNLQKPIPDLFPAALSVMLPRPSHGTRRGLSCASASA